uniref:Uncharacterized protein n=1 Tax=Cucumis melo TaxID=3656 RepID=A0A9I9D4V2_CUCME
MTTLYNRDPYQITLVTHELHSTCSKTQTRLDLLRFCVTLLQDLATEIHSAPASLAHICSALVTPCYGILQLRSTLRTFSTREP